MPNKIFPPHSCVHYEWLTKYGRWFVVQIAYSNVCNLQIWFTPDLLVLLSCPMQPSPPPLPPRHIASRQRPCHGNVCFERHGGFACGCSSRLIPNTRIQMRYTICGDCSQRQTYFILTWTAVLCILFQRYVAIPTENHRSNRNSIFSCRFGFHGFLPPATLNWEETYAISVIRCSAYILVRHIIMNNLQLNTLWRWQKWCLPKVARKSNIIQQYM